MPTRWSRRTTGGRWQRQTTAQRDELYRPVDHLVIFNSTEGRFQFYDAGFDQQIVGDGATSLDFVASTQTIEGEDFDAEGFVVGQWVVVSGAASNGGEYQVTAVDSNSITVARGVALVNENDVAATVDGRHGWRDHTGDQPSEL